MRVAALAVGEEGEEEEEEDEEEEAEGRAGHHHGARGPAMRSPTAVTVGGRSQWSVTTCPIFFVLLLLPVWILMVVVDASPLHPIPPHRGESHLAFFVVKVKLTRSPKVRMLDLTSAFESRTHVELGLELRKIKFLHIKCPLLRIYLIF